MKKLDEGFKYGTKEGILHCPGVRKLGDDISFTVAVPDKKRCSLLLYEKGSREVAASIPMGSSVRFGDMRSLLVEKLPAEKYEYNYLIDGHVVTDPYAPGVSGREIWGSPAEEEGAVRGRLCFEEYDWGQDKPLHLPWEEIVGYAAHVRGFTKHPSSRVRAKGTFAGAAEKIPYLKELGINQLELMPVYEFSETTDFREACGSRFCRPAGQGGERLNYWGYTRGFYFAPKASYSATGDPVRELKDLVRKLHENGIELILEFYFPKDTKTYLILDCIRYWVLEYHIDGVHINRDYAPVEVLAQDPLLSHTKIMTESFRMAEIYEDKYVPSYRNLAEYNGGFQITARRFLKGDEGQVAEFTQRVRRNPQTCGMINYMVSHNGFTLADLVSYDEKHNEANGEENHDGTDFNYSWNCGEEGPSRRKRVLKMRRQQMRNAAAFLLLSQGTPMLYGGDEVGNSQSGNNNVYCQDNEMSWINWRAGKADVLFLEYIRKLIAFRRRHPVFCQGTELRLTDYLSCGCPDVSYHGKRAWFGNFETGSRSVGILYAGNYVGANSGGELQDDTFYAAYNMHWTPQELALPALPGKKKWRLAVDTSLEGADGICPEGQEILLEDQRTIVVPERTVMVLIGK